MSRSKGFGSCCLPASSTFLRREVLQCMGHVSVVRVLAYVCSLGLVCHVLLTSGMVLLGLTIWA